MDVSLGPAASPTALKAIRGTIPSWSLHLRSDKALDDLARMYNSHQPLRRRERATFRFLQMRGLQKFASVHSSVFNHFKKHRHLNRRNVFKAKRAAAPAEWRQLGAA